MNASISYPEAAKALAEALAQGGMEGDTNRYYITAAEPQERDGVVVYMVGYAAADPEEDDEDGDPTGFIMGPDGKVLCTGPVF